eukprot:comp18488_c0_seq1/m.33147 comp18488_c0_seq1/g.33147  ORF comp18488_c0_seq1/g.33147 comp18488_c0_seq1/m.33147 type:complete len:322 (-) comp18488_c0_seq1:380-1345(-)
MGIQECFQDVHEPFQPFLCLKHTFPAFHSIEKRRVVVALAENVVSERNIVRDVVGNHRGTVEEMMREKRGTDARRSGNPARNNKRNPGKHSIGRRRVARNSNRIERNSTARNPREMRRRRHRRRELEPRRSDAQSLCARQHARSGVVRRRIHGQHVRRILRQNRKPHIKEPRINLVRTVPAAEQLRCICARREYHIAVQTDIVIDAVVGRQHHHFLRERSIGKMRRGDLAVADIVVDHMPAARGRRVRRAEQNLHRCRAQRQNIDPMTHRVTIQIKQKIKRIRRDQLVSLRRTHIARHKPQMIRGDSPAQALLVLRIRRRQ